MNSLGDLEPPPLSPFRHKALLTSIDDRQKTFKPSIEHIKIRNNASKTDLAHIMAEYFVKYLILHAPFAYPGPVAVHYLIREYIYISCRTRGLSPRIPRG